MLAAALLGVIGFRWTAAAGRSRHRSDHLLASSPHAAFLGSCPRELQGPQAPVGFCATLTPKARRANRARARFIRVTSA